MVKLKKDQQDAGVALQEIAVLLELKGENPFRIRAFQNAARILETLDESFHQLVVEERLEELPGIGEALAQKISEYAYSGKLAYLDELRSEFPETLFELLKITGLGPKKVRALYEKLDIQSIQGLEEACQQDKLTKLSGFGLKTQNRILEGIHHLKRNVGRVLFAEAIDIAEEIVEKLASWKEVQRVELAGSLRRRKETVKDADIVCSSKKPLVVMKRFVELPDVLDIIEHGEKKSSVRWEDGLQIDLRVVTDEQFPYTLHHFTGSKEHNTALRSRAKEKGLKMNEYGLFRGSRLVKCKDEKLLFGALGLDFIPPELREDQGEIDSASRGKIPKLIEATDLRGLFHFHTTYSDGRNSLEEMVAAAEAFGLEYLGIADHSQSAYYASGLNVKDLERQWKEMDRLQKKYRKVRIFRGVESDILPDGSLDYPESVLKKFDFVVGSVHSNFTMSEEEMTKRCQKALSNPYCTMLGHPTGRLLLLREGFKVDLHAIIDQAAKHKKIIELNAHPQRLDLDWRLLPYAKKKKVLVSINPDGHEVGGYDDARYGVYVARKGGLTKKDILNTCSAKEIERIFKECRGA